MNREHGEWKKRRNRLLDGRNRFTKNSTHPWNVTRGSIWACDEKIFFSSLLFFWKRKVSSNENISLHTGFFLEVTFEDVPLGLLIIRDVLCGIWLVPRSRDRRSLYRSRSRSFHLRFFLRFPLRAYHIFVMTIHRIFITLKDWSAIEIDKNLRKYLRSSKIWKC